MKSFCVSGDFGGKAVVDELKKHIFARGKTCAVIGACEGGKTLSVPFAVSAADILPLLDFDYCIVAGDLPLPRILCAADIDGLAAGYDGRVFALSGDVSASGLTSFKGCPMFRPETDTDNLLDYIDRVVFKALPMSDCGRCGGNCASMCADIVFGRKTRFDCAEQAAPAADGLAEFFTAALAGANGADIGIVCRGGSEITVQPLRVG